MKETKKITGLVSDEKHTCKTVCYEDWIEIDYHCKECGDHTFGIYRGIENYEIILKHSIIILWPPYKDLTAQDSATELDPTPMECSIIPLCDCSLDMIVNLGWIPNMLCNNIVSHGGKNDKIHVV